MNSSVPSRSGKLRRDGNSKPGDQSSTGDAAQNFVASSPSATAVGDRGTSRRQHHVRRAQQLKARPFIEYLLPADTAFTGSQLL